MRPGMCCHGLGGIVVVMVVVVVAVVVVVVIVTVVVVVAVVVVVVGLVVVVVAAVVVVVGLVVVAVVVVVVAGLVVAVVVVVGVAVVVAVVVVVVGFAIRTRLNGHCGGHVPSPGTSTGGELRLGRHSLRLQADDQAADLDLPRRGEGAHGRGGERRQHCARRQRGGHGMATAVTAVPLALRPPPSRGGRIVKETTTAAAARRRLCGAAALRPSTKISEASTPSLPAVSVIKSCLNCATSAWLAVPGSSSV